jgi:hypothetical protein
MLCDLQFFDDIIDNDNNAEQLTSQIICGDNELEPACFSLENQAVLQLPGEDVIVAQSSKRTFLDPIEPRVVSALLVQSR